MRSLPELLRWQWDGYPRYHRSRANLLLHIVVVPVFVVGNATLLMAGARGSWVLAGCAAAGMAVSVALQGAGHRQEPVPPEPFHGPLDFVSRLLCEQWVTFPRFVISGGWGQAWLKAGKR